MAMRDPVWDAARNHEPDRYLSALYAPEPARGRLMALAAFQGEIAQVPMRAREPMLLAIRLQWWRDALQDLIHGKATGNPIADRLAADVRSGLLPVGLLIGMIDAAGEPVVLTRERDPAALKVQLHKSHGAAFMLAARSLGAKHSDGLETTSQFSGYSYGLARLALASGGAVTPAREYLVAQSKAALPAACASASRLDSALLPGFLPLAMVNAYLDQAAGPPRTMPPDISALGRWWRLWRAQMSGRLI